MKSTRLPSDGRPTESGITLLEAYSALIRNTTTANTAIEIPVPGLPLGNDVATDFWHLQLRTPV